jgi:hypothetical protein
MQCTDALAFRAAAALDGYEEKLFALDVDRADTQAIAAMQLELRRLCTCCLGLPQLSGAALALLLAHHRLLADLSHQGSGRPADVAARSLRAVQEALEQLRSRCRELLVAPHLH